MLFLIHFLGGIYCLNKLELASNDDGIAVYFLCAVLGWLFIILYIIEMLETDSISSSANSYKRSPYTEISYNDNEMQHISNDDDGD